MCIPLKGVVASRLPSESMEEFYENKNTSLFSILLKRLTVKKQQEKRKELKIKKKRRNKMTKKKKKKKKKKNSILIYNRERSDIEVLVRPNGHA